MKKMVYDPKTGRLSDKPAPPPPTQRLVVDNPRYETESLIEWMDVDRVGYTLRAARGGSMQPLLALYRDILMTDSHIQAEFTKRKLAVLGDAFRIVPYDKRDKNAVAAATFCEQALSDTTQWRKVCSHLLDGCLLPVSVAEKVYAHSRGGFALQEIAQVPNRLLDYSDGDLRLRETDDDGQPIDRFLEVDPNRYIVHRGHLLATPDVFGGPMRSMIYWWLASTMNREWWVRFLDRYGMPFMVGHYTSGNVSDKNVLLSAFSAAHKVYGLAVSESTRVEIIEAAKSGADCFERFHAVAQREKSKLILGQTLSAQTDSTGMGSGVATMQGEVRDDIRRMDAQLLGETIRDQLFTQLCQINRLPGRPPFAVWGSASVAEQKAKAEVVSVLDLAGLELDDDGVEALSEEVGMGLRRKAMTPTVPFSASAAQEVGATAFFRRERPIHP